MNDPPGLLSSIFPAMSLIQVQVVHPGQLSAHRDLPFFYFFQKFWFHSNSLSTLLCHNQNLVVFRATGDSSTESKRFSFIALVWVGSHSQSSAAPALPTANIIRDKVRTIFAVYLEFFSCFLYDGTLIICI